ncbi:MAG: C4-dicarboxylate TRAP transporter substrate-binding protein [Alphaproteobacteria bacterium]
MQVARRLAGSGLAAAGFVAAVIGFGASAQAAETVKIGFVSGYPPAASWIDSFINHYVPAVDKKLAETGKYKIEWNLAHSGQVVKPRGELEAVQTGLADMGIVVTAFHLDRMPHYGISYYTPFVTTDMLLVGKTVSAMETKFPQFQQGWAKLGQTSIVSTTPVDDYQVISKVPITKLEDMKGMKISAAGPNLIWVTSVGATGITSALTDWYQHLNTGISEAVIGWSEAMGNFKLCEPAKYMLDADITAVQAHTLNVNLDFWKTVPEEVKQAILGATPVHQQNSARLVAEGAVRGQKNCTEQLGLKISRLSPEDRQKWADALPPVGKNWAADLEKQGIPGKEFLTFYMDAMRAANQPIARHWDRD